MTSTTLPKLLELKAYYFGCIDVPGHHFFDSNLRSVKTKHLYIPDNLPWTKIDGRLAPNARTDERPHRGSGPEIEGEALLHHKDGWTALCFWDRSVDSRGACNSNFFFKGTHTFEEIVELIKSTYPNIWGRYKFKVIDVTPEGLREYD